MRITPGLALALLPSLSLAENRYGCGSGVNNPDPPKTCNGGAHPNCVYSAKTWAKNWFDTKHQAKCRGNFPYRIVIQEMFPESCQSNGEWGHWACIWDI